MGKTRGNVGSWGFLLLCTVLLLAFPGYSLEGARKGVKLCFDLILPSLFPFFVLSSLLIATGLAEVCARYLNRFLSPLFGVGGSGAAALILGAVGGYPVGARTLAQLARTGECTHAETRRLSLFCNNCGPAFFIGAAGAGIFGSREAGFALFFGNLIAALLIGGGVRLLWGKAESGGCGHRPTGKYPTVPQALPDCVQSSFLSSLGVCAYVVLFSVLVTLLDGTGAVTVLLSRIPLEQAEPLLRALLTGLLEISTGTAALADGVSSPAALPLAAFLLGWGGLSVHCQTLPFWREAGVPVLPYLMAKLAQGLLSAGLTVVWVHFFPLTTPVMAASPAMSVPSLFGREMVALWGMAGIFTLFFRQKKSGNDSGKPL